MEKENTIKRDKRAIKLLQEHSQKEVGKIVGLSQAMVGKIAKKYGVKFKKSRLNMSRLNIDVDYFKTIDTPQKAYWLGFICADGGIKGGKVAIFTKDLEILEKIKKDIKSEHKITKTQYFDKRTKKVYTEFSMQITNEIFVSHLKKYGVGENKSNVLEFPRMIGVDLYPYFIAGLFDGDGSVSKNKRGILRCSLISTKEVLNYINQFFYEKFKWEPCSIQQVTKNKNNVFKGFWYSHSYDFLKYIYQGEKKIYLSRKYKIFENYNEREVKHTPSKQKVLQYTLEGKYIKMFETIKDACASVSNHTGWFFKSEKGLPITGYGFIWVRYNGFDKIKQNLYGEN